MTWLPHSSHPDFHEVWESTGAFAEEAFLRDVHEGRVHGGCYFCNDYLADPDFKPDSCPDYCPALIKEKKFELYCLYADFGDFMALVEAE